MNSRIALALLISGLSTLAGCAVNRVDTGRMVREMTDMPRLTRTPAPAYKTVQYSSYDRRGNLPGGPGWFGNSDGFGGETIPGFVAVLKQPGADGVGEYLICDVNGPGAIVRTWTAAIAGIIQVYLDGARRPLYDGPAEDFLLCPYQALQAANGMRPDLPADGFRQFQAAYCPIPFAKGCRIVWIGKLADTHFYEVQIRQYEPDALLQTFRLADLGDFAPELADASRILANPAGQYLYANQRAEAAIHAELPPGEQVEALKLDGPAALERLTLKVAAADLDRALRQTLLYVICDDYPWGQVQSPLGDFFGAAPGINPFNALPFTVEPDGTMTCRYVMPFEKSLRIVLLNRGEQPVTVTGAAVPMDYQWDERSMYFFARWRVDHGLRASPRAVQDMPYVIANGRGRYVGTALMLMNPCRYTTPYGSWWGEGDEKIFVDEQGKASTMGTGSEDYFNYAWSVPDLFLHAYCGQPRNDGPGNRGFVTNQRWHILDDLPFQQRLAFYMELYPHDDVPGLSYARIGYYYARPGTLDDHVAITDEDLRPLALPPTWAPASGFGMHGAIYHEIETLAPKAMQDTALEAGALWTGGRLLVWRPAGPGAELTLRFPVGETRKYRLHLGCRLDAASGRIAAKLDGQPATFEGRGPILDLLAPHRVLARQYTLEPREFTAGEHTLTILFDGAADSVREPAIGLDYLALQPG